MTVFIQIIRLEWDKTARGAEMAAKRNAIPTSFVMPCLHLSQSNGVIHIAEQYWSSENGFSHPTRWDRHTQSLSEPIKTGAITGRYIKGKLEISYSWNAWDVGAPKRPFTREFHILPNSWASVKWNGRSSCVDLGAWWYKQVAVNIALFDGIPQEDIFEATKPNLQLKQMVHLW